MMRLLGVNRQYVVVTSVRYTSDQNNLVLDLVEIAVRYGKTRHARQYSKSRWWSGFTQGSEDTKKKLDRESLYLVVQ
jgi:hypothetical protein